MAFSNDPNLSAKFTFVQNWYIDLFRNHLSASYFPGTVTQVRKITDCLVHFFIGILENLGCVLGIKTDLSRNQLHASQFFLPISSYSNNHSKFKFQYHKNLNHISLFLLNTYNILKVSKGCKLKTTEMDLRTFVQVFKCIALFVGRYISNCMEICLCYRLKFMHLSLKLPKGRDFLYNAWDRSATPPLHDNLK